MDWLILLPIFLPSLAGIVLLASSFYEHIKYGQTDEKKRKSVHLFSGAVLAVSAFAAALWIARGAEQECDAVLFDGGYTCFFQVDALGSVFASFMSIVWVLVAVYSFVYMEHEGNEKRFFGVYLLVYGVLIALDFAGNLVTLYLFYELMTLTSMPMVLHNGSKASIMAALEIFVLFYVRRIFRLFGNFFLCKYCGTLSFVAGGS